jgi:hypothetical protein
MTRLSDLSGAAIGELVLILGGLAVAIYLYRSAGQRLAAMQDRAKPGQDKVPARKSSTMMDE